MLAAPCVNMGECDAATAAPVETFRKDYKPPVYTIDKVDLDFDLSDGLTRVTSKLTMRRSVAGEPGTPPPPLVLDGEELKLVSLSLGGAALGADEYEVSGDTLIVTAVELGAPSVVAGEPFEFGAVVDIVPESNTQLSGLYKSSGVWCTQCEASDMCCFDICVLPKVVQNARGRRAWMQGKTSLSERAAEACTWHTLFHWAAGENNYDSSPRGRTFSLGRR